jgi:hypothetical protein
MVRLKFLNAEKWGHDTRGETQAFLGWSAIGLSRIMAVFQTHSRF